MLKIVCALYACLANSFLFDIDMLHSTAIENTNNIFYCSVKPTYVAFLALTLITTNYCSGTFLALHNREKEGLVVDTIRDSIFDVNNLIGVHFITIFGNYNTLDISFARPSDVHYFIFRSIAYARYLDCRTLDCSTSLESLLRLPHAHFILHLQHPYHLNNNHTVTHHDPCCNYSGYDRH